MNQPRPTVPDSCPTPLTSGNPRVGQISCPTDQLQGSDLQCPSVPGGTPTGGVERDTPQGPGRRARAAAVRASFQEARNAGLQRRHAQKLQHLARQTLTITRDELASALNFARCTTCSRSAELAVSLTTAGRLDWHARTTHTADGAARDGQHTGGQHVQS